MDRRGKIVLAALFLIVVGIMILVNALLQNVVVGYPIGLSFALSGVIFLINSD